MPIINCIFCNNEKIVTNKEINRGFGKFCNRKCSAMFREKNKIISNNTVCGFCQKEFYLRPSKIKRTKTGLNFCCIDHKNKALNVGGVIDIANNNNASIYNYRSVAFRVKPKVCERCGYNENEAAIIIHHKDGDRNNNLIENLEVLCCNCHAINHWGN